MLSNLKLYSSAKNLRTSHSPTFSYKRYSRRIIFISNQRFISNTKNYKDHLNTFGESSTISSKVTSEDIHALNHPKMSAEYSPNDLLSAYQFDVQDFEKNSDIRDKNNATGNLSLFLQEQKNKYTKSENKLSDNYLSAVDSSLKVKEFDETIKTRQDMITTKLNFFNSAISNNMFLTAFNLLAELNSTRKFSEKEIYSKYMLYLTSLINAKEKKLSLDSSIEYPVVSVDAIKKLIARERENGYEFVTVDDIPILAIFLQQLVKKEYKNNFEGVLTADDVRFTKTAEVIRSDSKIMDNLSEILKEEEHIDYDIYKVLYMIDDVRELIPESISSSIKGDLEMTKNDVELIKQHQIKHNGIALDQETVQLDEAFLEEYVTSFIGEHNQFKEEKLEDILQYKLAEKSREVLKTNASNLQMSINEKFELLKFFQSKKDLLPNDSWIEAFVKNNGEDLFALFKCIPYHNKELQMDFNSLLQKINIKRQLILEEGCVKSGEILSIEQHEESFKRQDLHFNQDMSDLMKEWQKQILPEVEKLANNSVSNSIVNSKVNEICRDLPPEVMSTLCVFAILKEMSFYKSKYEGDEVEDIKEARLATVATRIGQAICAEYTRYRLSLTDLSSLSKMRAGSAQFNRFYNKIYNKESHLMIEPSILSEVEINIGAVLLDIFLEKCTIVLKQKESNKQFEVAALKRSYETTESGAVGILSFHPSVVKKLAGSKNSSSINLHLLPMLCSPKTWTNYENGGYLTTRNSLLRTNKNIEQLNYLKQVCNTDDNKIPVVLSGVNTISQTAWTINKDVLKVVLHLWNSGEEFASIPPANFLELTDPKNPNNLLGLDLNDDSVIQSAKYNKTKELRNMRQKFFSIRCTESYKIELARAFCGEKMFFPHSLDFRGRAYPINVYLNQLGNDLSRGLIQFWDGKPLGKSGLTWLKIHLGNCFGMSKKTFVERVKFSDDNHAEIMKDCEDPLRPNAFWRTAEDEFQALATIIEIGAAMKNPTGIENYVCHLPVHQDGSCNGLQHYAALGGDVDGASKVNLLPAERPQDVYSAVCDIVNRKVKEEYEANKDNEVYSKRYEILKDIITRKVVKQPVMTTVYGVTAYGAKLQVAKQLMKLSVYNNDKSLSLRHGFYIANKIFDSINELFSNAEKIQDWLGLSSKLISKSLVIPKINDLKKKKIDVESVSTLIWTTPLGLPVVHPYRVSSKYTINTSLQSVSFTKKTSISKVDVSKQSNAFAPNYIHSLDASHMLMTAQKCLEKNITFSSVHDSYWSLAADADDVGAILREKFVELHSSDLIAILKEEFKTRYRDNVLRCRFLASSPLADEIRNYRLQLKKKIGHNPSIKDELTLEGFRSHFLKSDDPKEVAKGKSMKTLLSILETYDSEEIKNYMLDPKDKIRSVDYITGYVPIEFPEVPLKGELNLDDVKKSLYFFS